MILWETKSQYQFNNEYDLQITANSMLVNAYAGFNIDMAVIPKDPVKSWNTTCI